MLECGTKEVVVYLDGHVTGVIVIDEWAGDAGLTTCLPHGPPVYAA